MHRVMTSGIIIPARQREAFEITPGDPAAGVLLLCDHASNRMPSEYADLGLPPAAMRRHIAHDIGAAGVARVLSGLLDAPAILSRFSRLLIDPNRGLDDPTLVMRISDGEVIPGNAHIDEEERQRRIARFWRPYDDAITDAIARFRQRGIMPLLVSVHTFTPVWRGVPRPWHAGVLYDPAHPDISPRFIAALRRAAPDAVIGENEPYAGGLPGDTLDRHGVRKRLPHTLVELRQDLVAEEAGQRAWAERLAVAITQVLDATARSIPNSAGDTNHSTPPPGDQETS